MIDNFSSDDQLVLESNLFRALVIIPWTCWVVSPLGSRLRVSFYRFLRGLCPPILSRRGNHISPQQKEFPTLSWEDALIHFVAKRWPIRSGFQRSLTLRQWNALHSPSLCVSGTVFFSSVFTMSVHGVVAVGACQMGQIWSVSNEEGVAWQISSRTNERKLNQSW
jgi:hypothetical protein